MRISSRMIESFLYIVSAEGLTLTLTFRFVGSAVPWAVIPDFHAMSSCSDLCD